MLKEYDDKKKKEKNLRLYQLIKTFKYTYKQSYHIAWRVKKIQKKIHKLYRQKTRIILFSKCAVCDSKTSRFIKEQEASGLLSGLGVA